MRFRQSSVVLLRRTAPDSPIKTNEDATVHVTVLDAPNHVTRGTMSSTGCRPREKTVAVKQEVSFENAAEQRIERIQP